MDPFTHTFAGAALSRMGPWRATPLATTTLILAANVPDVDGLAYLQGEQASLPWRRGLTHGPVGLLVLSLALVGAMLAWDRWVRRRWRPEAPPARTGPLLALALAGAATHPLLDWMNDYGVRLLMPFHPGWFYGDALSIVDPWVWMGLGGVLFLTTRSRVALGALALFACLASLLALTAPIPLGAKAVWLTGLTVLIALRLSKVPRGREERVARWGVGAVLLYLVLMVGGSTAARREVARELAGRGVGPIESVMVSPRTAQPLAGTFVAVTPGAYLLGSFHWLDSPRVRLQPDTLARGPLTPVIEAATRVERARRYLSWARFPYYRVEQAGAGWAVRIGDARLPGERAEGQGGLIVHLDGQLAPLGD